MQTETFTLTSKKNQYFCISWQAANPKACICLIHGQGEHTERYHHVGNFFAQNQLSVFAIDLVGHGKSEGARGHINEINDYLENVSLLVTEVKARHPKLPIIVYGHSMGGNIVANYSLSNYTDPIVSGFILTSPWLKLAFEPPMLKVALAKLMGSIYPSFTEENELDGEGLSRDPEVGKLYMEDPLIHGYITAGAFVALTEAGITALENAGNGHKPTLVMHGSADPITSFQASTEFADKHPYASFKAWEACLHELHNDIDKEKVLQHLLYWVQETLAL